MGPRLRVLGQNIGVWGQDRRIISHHSKNFKVILTHGGYFEAPSGAHRDPNFGKLFLVIQLFNLNMIRGFGAKIEGSWAKIRVSGVKIVALVPTAQNFLKLF